MENSSARLPGWRLRGRRGFAEDEHGQVLAFDALGLGVEDEDALDEVAQLADVAGPVVLAECGEGVFGHLDVGAAVLRRRTPAGIP